MDNESDFSRVTIIGTGLMGGSMGLAVKDFYPEVTVAGVDFQKEIEEAARRNAVDETYLPGEIGKAIDDSELIFLATPIEEILNLVADLGKVIDSETLVVDLGSTKKEVCRTGWEAFDNIPGTFIGGHPMTGAETQGIVGAHHLLYENSVFVLVTPSGEQTEASMDLETFLRGLGAQPRYLKAEVHDRIVARVSHLPQLIAVSLMQTLGRDGDSQDYLSFAGGGFQDMTRIADSPFAVWEDIFATNGKIIAKEVERFREILQETAGKINTTKLKEEFKTSSKLRSQLPRTTKGISSTTVKVAATVPDRPGALAELTSAIAEEGINIKDLELQKVREDYGGTFHIYFDSHEDATRAKSLMSENGFEARVID